MGKIIDFLFFCGMPTSIAYTMWRELVNHTWRPKDITDGIIFVLITIVGVLTSPFLGLSTGLQFLN